MSAPIQFGQGVDQPVQIHTPDKAETERFLHLLDKEANDWTFQTFDDNKARRDPKLAKVLNGTLDECWGELWQLSQQGAGVFVTVNKTDGKGRKLENIVEIRAIWQEQDRPGCPDLPIDPHITVESSPGKSHGYILIEGCPLESFPGLQDTMVESFGSDPNAKDIARVLRLPGFQHQKDPADPHMVRIVDHSDEPPLTYEKAQQLFTPVVRVPKPRPVAGQQFTNFDLEEAKSALCSLNPDMDYSGWLEVGMSLHNATNGGDDGLTLWDEWSSNGESYQDGECPNKWDSFTPGGGITIKTLYKRAADTGWRWADQVSDSDEAGEWEPPVSLDQPDLPKFDQHDFPPILWRMIEAVSMATETPVELPGLIALSVAATAVQKRMKIEPEPGYLEPLNIWTCSILPPGARKSAVLTSLEKPLHKWERDQANLLEPIIQKATSKREVEEQRLKDLQRRYAKEEDATKRDVQLQEIEQLSVGLPEIPALPRLTAQDVTPEHLGVLLAENGERMGIFSAEGGIFGNIGGRYSNGVANLDLFLQSYSGDVVRVDRGSRPPVLLNNPALSMGLTVQPDVVKSLTRRREFRGQGLLARFQFALPENNIGRRTLITVPIPEEVEQVYSQIISRLLNWPVTDEAPAIKLYPEALSVWKQFQQSVEDGMDAGGLFEHMQDYAGKLPGAAARIAGIFHCVEHIHARTFPAIDDAGDLIDSTVLDLPSQPHLLPLSVDTMRRAVSLATKLSRHALCVYDLMEADDSIHAARRILQWVRRNDVDTFTARACHAVLKGSYPKRENINPGFDVLIERGYLRRVGQRTKKAGRPSEGFEVNPLFHR